MKSNNIMMVMSIVIVFGALLMFYLVMKPSDINFEKGEEYCLDKGGLKDVRNALLGDVAYCWDLKSMKEIKIFGIVIWTFKNYELEVFDKSGEEIKDRITDFMTLFVPIIIGLALTNEFLRKRKTK